MRVLPTSNHGLYMIGRSVMHDDVKTEENILGVRYLTPKKLDREPFNWSM